MKRRPAVLWIWYRGGDFHGFQRLPTARTVQGELQSALSRVGHPATPMPAGRTDRGVHARMQVVSVRLPSDVDPANLRQALNDTLPADVQVAAAEWAPSGFHAQWSAAGKDYRYRLVLAGEAPPGWRHYVWHVPSDAAFGEDAPEARARLSELTPARLSARLEEIPGVRRFRAFHPNSSVEKLREVHSVVLRPVTDGPREVLEAIFRGSAFARYMIRYLVGGAVAAASGRIDARTWRAALEDDLPFEGLRAPAQGLVLWGVHYPPEKTPFSGGVAALPRGPPFS